MADLVTKDPLVLLEPWDHLGHQVYQDHRVKLDLLDQLEREEKGAQLDHLELLGLLV